MQAGSVFEMNSETSSRTIEPRRAGNARLADRAIRTVVSADICDLLTVALVAVLAVVALFHGMIYPGLRRAHERAKVTQSQGVDPGVYRFALQVAALVLLPIVGFVAGLKLSSN